MYSSKESRRLSSQKALDHSQVSLPTWAEVAPDIVGSRPFWPGL